MLSKTNTLQVKGSAILMMIIYHLWGCPQKYEAFHPNWYGHPITKALVLCVPIYLFLSGYGMQCGGVFDIKKMYKRISKLYISFWLVFIPFVTLGTIIGYYHKPTSIYEFLNNFLGITYYYNAEWWFFCIYIGQLFAFIFLSRLKIKWYSYLGLMIAVFLVTRAILKTQVDLNFWFEMLLTYLNIFMLGCFFSKYDLFSDNLRMKNLNIFLKYTICVMMIIVSIILRAYSPSVGVVELVSVPLFVWAVCNISEIRSLGRLFVYFGKHSMNLWLLHSFFIFYYLNNLTFISYNPFVQLFLVVAQALICSIAIEYIKTKVSMIYYSNCK